MNFKRIMSLALVFCFCLSALLMTSCGETKANVRKEGETSNIDTNFPAGDYQGETFTFAKLTSQTSSGSEYYCGNWIAAEDINGVATNDAIYKRNDACKTKYNVNIEEKLIGEGFDDLDKYYKANDFCFDVIYGWGVRMAPAVTNNMLYDFRALDEAEYINLEADYWNPSALDDLTIAGKTYLLANDRGPVVFSSILR